jgi:hypothetical protein
MLREIIMIRCDDIFVDAECLPNLKEICPDIQTIRVQSFNGHNSFQRKEKAMEYVRSLLKKLWHVLVSLSTIV